MAKLPFFRRRRDDGPPLPTHHSSRRSRRASSQSTKAAPPEPYSMRRRPTFLLWLKVTILDLVTMAVLGALSLVVFRLNPVAHRNFPITFTPSTEGGGGTGSINPGSGDVVYPQFAYPYRSQFIPSHAATILAAGVPIATFLLAQIRVRSFWDLNNAIIGLLYGLITSSLFQVTIKWLIGGLRPNFLSVCNPDPELAKRPGGNATGLEGVGYGGTMYTYEICRGDENGNMDGVFNSLESFPSGHTTASFAGFVFLYLYLNAKLKVFSNYHPSMWKLALTYAPILIATLIGGSLTVDQSHNWYDILAGGIIGTVFALSSYRMVYASIWDWRVNHIPLHRNKAFVRAADGDDDVVGMGWTMTRRAGWGRRRGAKKARGGDEKLPAVAEDRVGSDRTTATTISSGSPSRDRRMASKTRVNDQYGRGQHQHSHDMGSGVPPSRLKGAGFGGRERPGHGRTDADMV